MSQIFDQLYHSWADRKSEIDREIDALERAIGLRAAGLACTQGKTWEIYAKSLTAKFQGLLADLANGVNMTEGERFHFQGRLYELGQIANTVENLKKENLADSKRLDQLRLERKNLKEEEVSSTGGTS